MESEWRQQSFGPAYVCIGRDSWVRVDRVLAVEPVDDDDRSSKHWTPPEWAVSKVSLINDHGGLMWSDVEPGALVRRLAGVDS